MAIKIVLPELDKDKKTVKDAIVSILSDKWPLTLKRIYNEIKKSHSLDITYQAVHKAINELTLNGIIEKKNREYRLNVKWINHLKEFSEKLKDNYQRESSFLETGSLTADTVYELYPFFADLLKKDVFEAKDKSICYVGHIVLNPQIGSEKEQRDYAEIIRKYKTFIISKNSSPLDKLWKTYWEKLGVKVKIGVKTHLGSSSDILIAGDYTIHTFHTKEVFEWEENLSRFKKISDIDMVEVNNIYFKNFGKIHVITQKNKEITDKIRQEIESFFK